MDSFRSEDSQEFNRGIRMLLTKKLKDQISDLAERSLPNECCGFILSDNGESFLFPCKNRFAKQFYISPIEFLEAKTKGQIEAIYHSHPNGEEEFSSIDKKNSLHHGIKFILYNVKLKTFKEFGYDSKYHKYVGKIFEMGIEDCFSLVKRFYKNELKINISDYERGENWTSEPESPLDSRHKTEGFSKVDSLKEYDLIMFKSLNRKSFSGHVAVYLGDDLMLHNQRTSFSKVEEYSDAYKRLTNYALRHETLL